MCLFGSEGKEIGDKTAEQKDFELTSSHKHTKKKPLTAEHQSVKKTRTYHKKTFCIQRHKRRNHSKKKGCIHDIIKSHNIQVATHKLRNNLIVEILPQE